MKTLKKIAAAAAAIILVLTLVACGLPFRGPHSGSVVAGKPVDIPGLRGYFTPQNGGAARTTVMFYVIGSDLETDDGAVTTDIGEILSAADNRDLNIVFQTGGCLEWQSDAFTDGKAERFRAEDGGLTFLGDLGAADMLDPATLSSFIRWSAEEYPADRYILILWDHGGGVLDGFGYDEIFPDSSLGIDDLASALKDGGVKFDIVGFDACFMATLETAYALEPYADYLISSEESEPSDGWDYTEWIAGLSLDPSTPTLSLAEKLISGYVSVDSEDGDVRSLSLVDLREIPYVAGKLRDLLCGDGAPDPEEVASERAALTEFGGKYYDQVDLYDFADRFDTPAGKALCAAVSSAVKLNGSNFYGANGLSLYFPCHYPYAFHDNAAVTLNAIGFPEEYVKYLWNAARDMMKRHEDGIGLPAWYAPDDEFSYEDGEEFLLSTREKSYGDAIIFDQMDYCDIEEIALHMECFDGDSWIDLGYDCNYMFDDDGDLSLEFEPCWIALDGMIVPFTALADEESDVGTVYSYGIVPAQLNSGPIIEVVVYWDNTYAGGYVAGYRMENGNKNRLFGFKPGDRIEPIVDVYTPDGEYEGEYAWGDPIKVTDGRISVSYEGISDFDVRFRYRVGFSSERTGYSPEIEIKASEPQY